MTIRLITLAAVAWLVAAAPTVADTIAITNARVQTMGKQGEIASATIVMRDGRISAVGANVRVPAGATVIDAKGRIVTPGLYIAGTDLGAHEIELISATQDTATKNSALSAAFDVQYGIDANAIAIPVARMTGVTRAVVMPAYTGEGERELLFAGQAAIVTLRDGVHPVVRPHAAMLLELGESGAARAGGGRGSAIVALKADLGDVRWYARQRGNFDRGSSRELRLARADLEALLPVVRKSMPLVVVHRATDILETLKLAKREGLKIILSGATEGWMLAREIAKAGVPVLLNPTANLPASFEQRAATMENAARLHKAGVTIAFANADGAARIREVRYNAGNAVANGLPYAAALAAITINPARIFGEAAKTGSIEAGKQADVVIWSGDPLEPLSQADAVYIAGEAQPLTSRGQDLARRYKTLQDPYPPAYKE